MIETIKNGFPLNVMYWVKTDEGNYEVMDGQQRTISIGQYVNGDFSLNDRFFHNLTDEEQEQILDYELMIYFKDNNLRKSFKSAVNFLTPLIGSLIILITSTHH